MSNWPQAVIFDFDGVIVNSEPLHMQAFVDVLGMEKIRLTEFEYYQELIGFDDKGAFNYIFKKHEKELDPKTFLRVMANKSKAMMEAIHRKQYQALPGVEEFVRGLWRNYPLAICSGALREEIEAMLEGISLRDCFSIITAAEDVTVGKPDPAGYIQTTGLISKKVGKQIKSKDVLIVEDAPAVIKNAKKVGFKTLAVATSYEIDKLGDADWAVKTLEPAGIHKLIPELKLQIG